MAARTRGEGALGQIYLVVELFGPVMLIGRRPDPCDELEFRRGVEVGEMQQSRPNATDEKDAAGKKLSSVAIFQFCLRSFDFSSLSRVPHSFVPVSGRSQIDVKVSISTMTFAMFQRCSPGKNSNGNLLPLCYQGPRASTLEHHPS